ncbi:arf-gap with ank repeat and ph domain-containing protein 9, partial [Nannochloropsis oceanica]
RRRREGAAPDGKMVYPGGPLMLIWRERRKDEFGCPLDGLDSSRLTLGAVKEVDWTEDGEEGALAELKRRRFVTGGWGEGEEEGGEKDDDGEVFGDFEDLETGQRFGRRAGDEEEGTDEELEARQDAELARLAKKVSLKEKFNAEFDSGKIHQSSGVMDSEGVGEGMRGGKKVGRKSRKEVEEEDAALDEEERQALLLAAKLKEDQKARNQAEFAEDGYVQRLKFEGFRQGLYVRISLKGVSAEFSQHFRPSVPVVVGGLLPHETAMGLVRCRVKKHRWHRKILKANDPVIFSLGWRRFQSVPIFSTEDQNERQRYLKYTPEHMHCFATFYGPLCPPNTGLLAFQSLSSSIPGFRVALTGIVLELDSSFHVAKKLKLIGTPCKIFKNTAFISGMFNSDLEVAKFEGAKIRTVSGVRGQIKKAAGPGGREGGRKGTFRATFEDKVLMSDIVFCRTWVPVEPARLYNPVCSLLARREGGREGATGGGKTEGGGEGGVALMKTTAMLRREKQVPIPVNKDSLYKPVVREVRKFNTLQVPKSLQAALPFASKPKVQQKRSGAHEGYLKKRAVVMDPEEKKKHFLLQALATVRNAKLAKAKLRREEKLAARDKVKEKQQELFAVQGKTEKKRKYREQGKAQQARQKRRS